MLLTKNAKMQKTGKKHASRLYSFNLPPIKTCPFANQCKKGCYAMQGRFCFRTIKAKLEQNYQTSLSDSFEQAIIAECTKTKADTIRIHSSGDYYSQEYLQKWINIAKALTKVTFYSYTKSVEYVKQAMQKGLIPSNMFFVFSLGGIQDTLIDVNTDRHSRVFPSLERLEQNGYASAINDDYVALGQNKKIGLVYHGTKSLKNTSFEQD